MGRKLELKEFNKLPLGLRGTVKKLYEDPKYGERVKAVKELGEAYTEYKDANDRKLIIKHIISAFRDESLEVRETAKNTLHFKIGLDAFALEKLIETMKTNETRVKDLATRTLSKLRESFSQSVDKIQPSQQPFHYALANLDPVKENEAFLKLVEKLRDPKYENKTLEFWNAYVKQLKEKYAKTN